MSKPLRPGQTVKILGETLAHRDPRGEAERDNLSNLQGETARVMGGPNSRYVDSNGDERVMVDFDASMCDGVHRPFAAVRTSQITTRTSRAMFTYEKIRRRLAAIFAGGPEPEPGGNGTREG